MRISAILCLTHFLFILGGCSNDSPDTTTNKPPIGIQPSETSHDTNAKTLETEPHDATVANYAAEAKMLEEKMAESLKANASEDDIQIMKSATETLAQAMPNPGLTIGTQAPDFSLPNAQGESISLSAELKKGPVVLVFYRGSWCPFCNLHLHTLQSILPDLKTLNAQLIAITPQLPDESKKELEDKGYPFHVLSDLTYSVTQAYRLYFELAPELLKVYKKFNIDLELSNGEGRTGLPIPGTLVIDRSGNIIAAHADTDYKKRMEPAQILAALQNMPNEPGSQKEM